MLAETTMRRAPEAEREHPPVASSLVTLQRFNSLSPVLRHVCLLLAEGAQGADIATRLGISLARLQALRSTLLRRMGAESQIDLALRINRLERSHLWPAVWQAEPSAADVPEHLEILIIDREPGRAEDMRAAIRQLQHVVCVATNEDSAKLNLSRQSFDVCMVAHGTRGDLIPLLRTSVPLKDRPIIVQYTPREGRDLKIRHCGDIISADIPRNFQTIDLKQLFAYCTFEDISITPARRPAAPAALC